MVGEEGVAADPAILAHLHGTVPAWLVDPLDGTANFAAGREPFAVMVALLEAGVIRASWILDPIADRLLTAEAGRGSYLDGVAVRPTVDAPATALRGAVMSRFLPPAWRSSVEAGAHRLGTVLPGQHCAGREYADILTGAQQFALFWRTLPWDHAPGVLLLQEAGGGPTLGRGAVPPGRRPGRTARRRRRTNLAHGTGDAAPRRLTGALGVIIGTFGVTADTECE